MNWQRRYSPPISPLAGRLWKGRRSLCRKSLLTIFLLGLFLLMLVFTMALSLIIPLAARRDLLFGVTVPPNTRSTPEGRRITRTYAAGVIALSVLSVGDPGSPSGISSRPRGNFC